MRQNAKKQTHEWIFGDELQYKLFTWIQGRKKRVSVNIAKHRMIINRKYRPLVHCLSSLLQAEKKYYVFKSEHIR